MPYTIALVIVGLVIGWLGKGLMPDDIELTGLLSAETILFILLPPLLFEGAAAMDIGKLKQNWRPISLLAIPGVMINTAIIGVICWKLVWPDEDNGLLYGLLIGSILAATDPVSVLALVKTLGAPKRLSVLIEGESLFNDGTAIVLFNILLLATLAVLSGQDIAVSALLTQGIGSFLFVVVVGAIAGLLCGLVANWLLSQTEDHLVEIAITLALAFGAFLLAELLHGSGVISVVIAGLLVGNHGVKQDMTASARIGMHHFWEVVVFLVNSVLFLLVGYELQAALSWDAEMWELAAIGISAALIARLVVFPLTTLSNIGASNPISTRWQVTMWWGGLRGSIPIALLLLLSHMVVDAQSFEYGGESLSATFDAAIFEDMLVLAFSVVLFSLLVQGLTMKPLMDRLGVSGSPAEDELRYEVALAEVLGSRAALRRLSALSTQGMISAEDQESLSVPYRERVRDAESRILELTEKSIVRATRIESARRELILEKISALRDAERKGILSSSVVEHQMKGLDEALGQSEHSREELTETARQDGTAEATVTDEFDTLIPETTEAVMGQTISEMEEE